MRTRAGILAIVVALAAAPAAAAAPGDKDFSFGERGFATIAGELFALASIPAGGALVGGSVPSSTGDYRMAIGRVTAAGGFDGTFGLGGLITTAIPGTTSGEAQRVASTASGPLAVGYATTDDGSTPIAMARYRPNGLARPHVRRRRPHPRDAARDARRLQPAPRAGGAPRRSLPGRHGRHPRRRLRVTGRGRPASPPPARWTPRSAPAAWPPCPGTACTTWSSTAPGGSSSRPTSVPPTSRRPGSCA